MKKLFVMTGPQGSGNHLFSKAFGLNANLWGWEALQTKYWEGHDSEPFADYWKDPETLKDFDWTVSQNYITSISCPYYYDGEVVTPSYKMFQECAEDLGITVKYIVIGRDQNILKIQQTGLRDRHTTPDFIGQMNFIHTQFPIYASQEMLYLYRLEYLNSLETQMQIPVSSNREKLEEILEHDANAKYINPADSAVKDYVKTAMKGKGLV